MTVADVEAKGETEYRVNFLGTYNCLGTGFNVFR